MKRNCFNLLIVILLCLSCQSHQAIPENTIVVGIEAHPEQLDPRLATDAISSKIKDLVYSGLLKLDDSLNLVPDLAESYEQVDSVTYKFILKKGVIFHHGKKLTSEDVKATFESMADTRLRSPYLGSLKILKNIETPDERTVIFRLNEPFTPFLTLMKLAVLPKEIALQYQNENKAKVTDFYGTGPYQIKKYEQGADKLYLERFEKYHGPLARTKRLIFWTIQDNTLRAMELIKGRIDLVQNALPYVLVPVLKKKDNLKFKTEVGINYNYLAFHFKNEYLKHKKVRQAIAHAIERDQIIKYKLYGLARKADSLLSPKHWAYHSELGDIDFNLQKAKRLLDEAGFPDPDGDGPKTRFQVIYKTSTNKDRLQIVQLIAENLRKIGIGVVIRSYEFGTLYRDIRQGDFDLFSLTWVGISDPDIYYYVFHPEQVPPKGANRGFYINDKLGKILEQTRVEPDLEKRKRLYHQIQKIVYEDMVYVPLWYEDNFVVMNQNIEGYQLRPDAGYDHLVNAYKVVGSK